MKYLKQNLLLASNYGPVNFAVSYLHILYKQYCEKFDDFPQIKFNL